MKSGINPFPILEMKKPTRPVSSKWIHLINEDTSLSFVARSLSVSIFSLSLPGHCFATNATLAKRLGCSSVTISRAVSELSKHGYIKVDIDKSRGNWRLIIPTFPSIKCADTPIITDDVTSDLERSDPQVVGDYRSSSQMTNGIVTGDYNNKKKEQEESNKMIEQKNDGVGVGLKDDEINAQISELENFDGFRLCPFRDLTKNKRILLLKRWRKILLERTRLEQLNEDDQILVLLCLYSLLDRTVHDYEYEEKLLRQAFRSGKTAVSIFTAMWRLHHNLYATDGKKWKNGWNLEFICSEEKGIDWIHNNFPMNAPGETKEEEIKGLFELVVSPDTWPADRRVVKHPDGTLERM